MASITLHEIHDVAVSMPSKPSTSARRSAMHDPRASTGPFQLDHIESQQPVFEPKRTNYFSVYLIEHGDGLFQADTAQHEFHADQLLFFRPYQHCRFELRTPLRCTRMQFHANFLCVETFHAETGCSGVLFNDPYGRPIVPLGNDDRRDVGELIERMRREQTESKMASQEAILACMKLLLIVASRLKTPSLLERSSGRIDHRDTTLSELRELIEAHFQSVHSPAAYARMMHLSPKTLAKHVREAYGKTPTELIRERILTHAKWHLLHTLKPIKQVASEVGFHDELYFSRVFKAATGVSPKFFREFETEIRGGSNLSMTST